MPFAHSETPEHVGATLGAVLRRHREAGEWSLADIAKPAGISTAYLSEVERGQKDISTERLMAVARALDVTIGQLYLELARELGAGEPVKVGAWEAVPLSPFRPVTPTDATAPLLPARPVRPC